MQMLNFVWSTFKATILRVIVALFSTFLILLVVFLIFGAGIEEVIFWADKISLDTTEVSVAEETVIDESTNKIQNYPEYGTQYATIQIPSIDVDLPVYFGDTLEILKKGVGHSSGSYFPGEGGSIIYMGHNSTSVFRRFSELELGDEITVQTSYGTYVYEIYDMQIINETDLDMLPIQKEEEILMIYTCYPFNNIGYATQRYVVYAEKTES